MQLACHVLAYNVTPTLKLVLQNIAPHVDKIYVAHPIRPWNYIPSSRATKTNPTTIEDVDASIEGLNAQVIRGDWETEEETRQACLDLAKDEGFDWLLTQDADEFYTDQSWSLIRKTLYGSFHREYFVSTWYNFWKSAHYVVAGPDGEIKSTNAGLALRCRPDARFHRARLPVHGERHVIDAPCFHYGYVRTDAEIMEKVETWKHAREFNAPRWYRNKWQYWNESTLNLHPTAPWVWKRAIRFPLEQPEFSIPFSLSPAISPRPLIRWADDALHDAAVGVSHRRRQLRDVLKAGLSSK